MVEWIRPNNNKPQYILLNVALTIRGPFFCSDYKALWLIRFSLNEIPSSGCDSSFTLLSIASSPYQVISGINVHNSSKYTTMIHAQLFQCPFDYSKSISCRWYCQCSLEYLHYTNPISMMCREKMYALPVPSRIRHTYAWKALGTKVILGKGGESKVFNLTLMNKLMRMEWVSEWVSAIRVPPKAHGMTRSSMS